MPSQNSQIKHFFGNVQKKLMNTAQRRLTELLPGIMSALNDYAKDEEMNANFSDMTGNWINSFGVACYRDGRCFAVANMSGEERNPIRTTLIKGDYFGPPGDTHRFDGSEQQNTFEVGFSEKRPGTAAQVFYNEEVLEWLGRTRTRAKGFSFRVISITEYHKKEARNALLRLSDEIEGKGGNIWKFNIG